MKCAHTCGEPAKPAQVRGAAGEGASEAADEEGTADDAAYTLAYFFSSGAVGTGWYSISSSSEQ